MGLAHSGSSETLVGANPRCGDWAVTRRRVAAHDRRDAGTGGAGSLSAATGNAAAAQMTSSRHELASPRFSGPGIPAPAEYTNAACAQHAAFRVVFCPVC